MDISVMISEVKFNYRVGAILKHKDKILIETSDSVNYSVIPGGRVKLLEDTKYALNREIEEELGIDISKCESKLISVVENFFKVGEVQYHELYFIYKVELDDDVMIEDGMVNLDSYGSKYYWKSLEELKKVKMLPQELKEIATLDEFKKFVVRD